MGLSEKRVGLKRYFVRRLTRLEPPFIVTLVVFYLVHVLLLGENVWVFLQHLGAGLIYGHVFIYGTGNSINPVTWSLETEAQFYLIIPLIMCIVFRGRNSMMSILVLLGLIVGSIIFRNEFAFSPYWGRSIGAYFINFAMGLVVCWLYLKFPFWIKGRSWLYDVLGVLATFGLFYFYKPQHEISNQIFFNISITLIMITAFKGKFFNWFYTLPLIYIIGGMCYSIYLIHYAFLHLSVRFTKYLMVDSWSYSQNLVIQVIVNVALVIMVSAVFFTLIEKPTMDKNWPTRLLTRFKIKSS